MSVRDHAAPGAKAVENGQEGNPKIDLDTILVKEIGQFGKFQLRTTALAMVSVIFHAWASGEYIFTTARINTRCLIPECEEAATAEFVPEWILNAVPGTSSSSFDNCQRFGNAANVTGISGTCPVYLFDANTLLECEEYIYENTDTIVHDFGLACDEWRRSIIGSIRAVAIMICMPITGFISDHWGRRTALAAGAINMAWLGIVRYWANTYVGFVISEFVEALFGGGVYSGAYILVLELVGPKYRVAAGATVATVLAIGQMFLGLIAWGVPNWRMLTLTLYIPQLLVISYFWIMPESVRWYLSKGRFEEAEALLKEVARVNGKQLSEKLLAELRETTEEEKQKKTIEKKKVNEPWLVVKVFRHKRILIRCLVSPVWWITTTLIYFSMALNAVNLSGNRYLNYVAVAAAEIPGYWTAVLLLDRVGRKPVLVCAFWICAACQIAFVFIPDDLYTLSLAMYLLGTISIAMSATALYVYTAELYPTNYRHSLFAFSSTIGRVGAIVAPLTPAIGAATFYELPFLVFAGLALVSGLLVFATPETRGTKLPDTLEDASNIGLEADTK